MKIKSIFVASSFVVAFLVACPYLSILITENFELPIWRFTFLKITGVVIFACGILIFLHCSMLFAKFGKGTPIPTDPPKEFVIKGLYKYVRNPIYTGYFAMLLGEFLLFGHILLLGWAIIALMIFHVYILIHEEPGLRKRFGSSYTNYTKEVPRWVPRF